MAFQTSVDPKEVQRYVIQQLMAAQGVNLAKQLQDRFGVSRATAHNYLRELIASRLLERTKPGQYRLAATSKTLSYPVSGLREHTVWANDILPLLKDLPENVVDIWHYGCTEMINNVIDHSESQSVLMAITRNAASVEINIHDYGVGIFRKIARALQLDDDRHAVLELSKGKVTTDPENHTGEGIFFSSRAFDSFRILSGGVFFDHERDHDEDWIIGEETPPESVEGTSVFMGLANNADRRLRAVFDEYATDTEDYRFDRTVVPVKLLQYGDDRLVSRSQAKRLLNRFDRFKTVVLNFEDVASNGQAFADEVFRVFPAQHPEVELVSLHANELVARMINRAVAGRQPQRDLFTRAEGDGPQGDGAEGNGPEK